MEFHVVSLKTDLGVGNPGRINIQFEKNLTGKYPKILEYPGTTRVFKHVMRNIVNKLRYPIILL